MGFLNGETLYQHNVTGAGAESARGCFSTATYRPEPVRPVAHTTVGQAATTVLCTTIQLIPASMTGAGVGSAKVCSSSATGQREFAQQVERTTTVGVETTACVIAFRPIQGNMAGAGVAAARACTLLETSHLVSVPLAVDMTSQEAATTVCSNSETDAGAGCRYAVVCQGAHDAGFVYCDHWLLQVAVRNE